MKKIILNMLPDSGGRIFLGGNYYHYLVHVRRVRPGSVINAVLPGETRARLVVQSIDNDVLIAACESPPDSVSAAKNSLPPLYLFQALPKGLKMDMIVRQAAECGIREIIPFFSENSQIRINDPHFDPAEVFPEKIRRWERIIREARQQSGSDIPTAVRNPCSFDGIFLHWKKLCAEKSGGVGILLHQNPLEPGSFHDYLGNNPGFVAMAVGPEGGFSSGEASRFIAEGFRPLVMGDTVLRTETAALYGAAAIRIILTESAFWQLKKNRNQSAGAASTC